VHLPSLITRAARLQMRVRAEDRAQLVRAGAAVCRLVLGRMNKDEDATVGLVAGAMLPGTDGADADQQRATADHRVAANIVTEYLAAIEHGKSKREQRQIMSALAPRKGRVGYTRRLLREHHDLDLTKHEWRCVRLHAYTAGCAATAAPDAPAPMRMKSADVRETAAFL
jgi:hypothetical protein